VGANAADRGTRRGSDDRAAREARAVARGQQGPRVGRPGDRRGADLDRDRLGPGHCAEGARDGVDARDAAHARQAQFGRHDRVSRATSVGAAARGLDGRDDLGQQRETHSQNSREAPLSVEPRGPRRPRVELRLDRYGEEEGPHRAEVRVEARAADRERVERLIWSSHRAALFEDRRDRTLAHFDSAPQVQKSIDRGFVSSSNSARARAARRSTSSRGARARPRLRATAPSARKWMSGRTVRTRGGAPRRRPSGTRSGRRRRGRRRATRGGAPSLWRPDVVVVGARPPPGGLWGGLRRVGAAGPSSGDAE